MKKVAFKNLGCKTNSYEIEKIRDTMPKDFIEVDFKEKADLYVINTCSVTHVADRKSRQMIHQAVERNKKAIIVICGCFVNNIYLNVDKKNKKEIYEKIFDTIKIIEKNIILLDNKNKLNLWNEVNKKINAGTKNITKEKASKSKTKEISKSNFQNNKIRAFLKIEDGCNNFCSYCIIPYLRGRIESRNEKDIIKDAKIMVKKGIKEIVLTGIDINAYGKDFINKENLLKKEQEKNDKNYTNYALLDIIKKICDIDGILRVRIGSLHPHIITEEFVSNLTYNTTKNENIEKFCPEFHLSLQSGSNEILDKMNRKYNVDDYEKAVKIIRKYFKNATITTDIIVGFPEETDKNFKETCDFVKKIKFYNPHIFKYSVRKNTIAEKLQQVPDKIKNEREKKLIDITDKISDKIRHELISSKKQVLIEEIKQIDNKLYAVGFTKEYIKIKIDLSKQSKEKINDLVGTELLVDIKNNNQIVK